MSQTLTGLFDTMAAARHAVRDLEAAGVPHADISLVANNTHGEHAKSAEEAGKGAGIGAAVGGAGGLLAGLGMLAIPGVGPVVAAGWLVATVAGAVGGAAIGGVAGGLVGALTKAGLSEVEAHVYAEGVRRGGALVSAKVADDLVPIARPILKSSAAVDVQTRGAAYRESGWSNFDPDAPQYTAAEIAAERERYPTL